MKKSIGILWVLTVILSFAAANALLTFYMVDNFEDGTFSKWYVFDNIKASAVDNPAKQDKDSIGDSCGDKSLKIAGAADNWYVGGIGTILDVDAVEYSRFSIDVYGTESLGKLKIELFEKKSEQSTEEAKWIAEVPVLGEGFSRFSIPFSSFRLDRNNQALFHSKKGGKISKIQLICVASSEKGSVGLTIDNLIFTY
ncbi:hypothetical protein HZC34_00945 [Candidatus Saganbacteria bacterium]|nr:hypothetical protein [Candidatus Saganbacteria bacterium]